MIDKLKNEDFKKIYFDVLKYRMSYGSLELEDINDDLAGVNQSVKIFNTLSGLQYMLDKIEDEPFNHYEFTEVLCNIVDKVTNSEIDEFRKINAFVVGSNVKRTSPQMIRNDLWYLIDDYNYRNSICKTDDDRFELEAMFHIRLLHIHPFEDGNGRTARILLNYNLIKSGYAPVIITNKTKKEYSNLIEDGNVRGLAEMFKKLSETEIYTINTLYDEINSKAK